MKLTAPPRHLLDENSATITLRLGASAPTPSPVMSRAITICWKFSVRALKAMPAAITTRLNCTMALRPSRSANGVISTAPNPMPTMPALSRKPSCVALRLQAVEMAEAVNTMAMMS